MSNEFVSSQEKRQQFENNIGRALDILDKTGEDPLVVFPDPSDKERRMDVEWVTDMTPEQEEAFRANAAELGFGREENIGPVELGVSDGYVAVLEGGLPHKMVSELALVNKDDDRTPAPSKIVFAVSHDREIKKSERKLAKKQLDLHGSELPKTEHELAIAILQKQDTFDPAGTEYSSTADHDGYTLTTVGDLNGVPVQLLGTYRSGPRINNSGKVQIVAETTEAQQIVFVTSSTYQSTNELQAIDAAEKSGREVFVATYGINELAIAKKEEPQQPALNQLGGEYHKLAKQIS
jgi:hypothetical protein